ncbi:HPr family phosphocarrier protein [Laceyella putida]|uniref:HPr family phosphocarrier protein n=1 Tax=Laceyella putida TaxID=110101 RepID=A0ABW2RK78_9BACL
MERLEYSACCQIPSKIALVDVIRFVEKADQYRCYIIIEANHISINAKSLLSMCMLVSGLIKGPAIIRTSGEDARKALEEMKWLLTQTKRHQSQAEARVEADTLANIDLCPVDAKEKWGSSPPDI